MYEQDLALNNLQWLICHKTKPNKFEQMLEPTHYETATVWQLTSNLTK